MPEYTPTPDSYMGRVDKAGGIEAYKLEQAKEFMKEASKIKPNQWKGINEVLTNIKGFIDVDANTLFGDVKNSIVESITLKTSELLSPLKNELNESINTLLEPFLPFIEDMLNLIVPVVGWIADRIQDMMDFFGMGSFTVGDYTFLSYTGWLATTGGIGSIFDYYYYVLGEALKQRNQDHSYMPSDPYASYNRLEDL